MLPVCEDFYGHKIAECDGERNDRHENVKCDDTVADLLDVLALISDCLIDCLQDTNSIRC